MEIALEIGAKHRGFVEITRYPLGHTVHVLIDAGSRNAEIGISAANITLSVCGEPFHISDRDMHRLLMLSFPDGEDSIAKKLADFLMVECGEFFESSETVCHDNRPRSWNPPIIGICAATFRRRRELMIACISRMNERFFQELPIQIGTEYSRFFLDETLPFDYDSLPTCPKNSPGETLSLAAVSAPRNTVQTNDEDKQPEAN